MPKVPWSKVHLIKKHSVPYIKHSWILQYIEQIHEIKSRVETMNSAWRTYFIFLFFFVHFFFGCCTICCWIVAVHLEDSRGHRYMLQQAREAGGDVFFNIFFSLKYIYFFCFEIYIFSFKYISLLFVLHHFILDCCSISTRLARWKASSLVDASWQGRGEGEDFFFPCIFLLTFFLCCTICCWSLAVHRRDLQNWRDGLQ